MKKILLALFLLVPLSAGAQSVQQSGTVTPGHNSCWAATGIVYDCGVTSGPSIVGSTTANDFTAFNGSGSLIDSGFSATGTNNWIGAQNLNGGATAPTRANGDNTTNVATTAFVQNFLATNPVFTNGIEISGPGPSTQAYYPFYITNGETCAIGCGGILVAGTVAGTTSGQVFWNNLTINTDNAVIPGTSSLFGLYVEDNLTGTALTGGRTAILAEINQTAVSANGVNRVGYVGVIGKVHTSSGDGGSGSNYYGDYYGGNFFCGNDVSSGNLYICTGAEFDNYGLTAGTQNYKFGINIGDGNGATAHTWDTAIAVYTLGAATPYPQGRGWQTILSIGDVAASGVQPLASSGTIIGEHLEALTQINVANGIDWTHVVCTNNFVNFGGNLIIDCSGDITASGFIVATGTIAAATTVAIPTGGTTDTGFRFTSTDKFGIFPGTGAPTLTAAEGSLYLRNDNGTVYVNTNGTTGWGALLSSATAASTYAPLASPTFTGLTTFSGQFISTFGTPTIASGACGTGTNGSISGTNQSGIVTIGSATTTTCTVSFSTTLTAPGACIIAPGNAAAGAAGTTVARVGTPGTGSWVITGSALANTVYSYICV